MNKDKVIGVDTAGYGANVTNITVRFSTSEGGRGVVGFEGHDAVEQLQSWLKRSGTDYSACSAFIQNIISKG